MKKFFRKMTASFVVTIIAVVLVMSVAVFTIRETAVGKDIRQMLRQIEHSYELAWQENESNGRLQETDYVNRAESVLFILEHDNSLVSDEGLGLLCGTIGVSEIHVFDKDANVIATTVEERRGGSADEGTRLREYLLDSASEPYEVYWRPDTSKSESFSCSVAIKTEDAPFYAVLLVMEEQAHVHRILSKDALIKHTLGALLTEYDTTVFAISNTTGKVVGMTDNNPQAVRILDRHGNDVEDIRKKVEPLKDSIGFLRMKDGDVVATSTVLEDYTLVGFVKVSTIVNDILMQMLAFLLLTIFFCAIAMRRITSYWNRYLMEDLRELEKDMYRVLAGDFKVEANCVNNEDLNSLAIAFNSLKEGYENKEERLSRFAANLGGGIALFDFVHKNGLAFASDNMREILGMTPEAWSNIRDSYQAFEQFLDDLLLQKDEDGIVHFNGRHLDIRMVRDESGISGVVIDSSVEINHRNQLLSRLSQAEAEIVLDHMTGLFNRKGFEQEVTKHLSRGKSAGVMLMMDMDNFKIVNDTLGHPEGDRLLGLVGTVLKRVFRENDVIAHLSGDEFAVFMPTSFTVDVLTVKLERLIDELHAATISYHKTCGVTMSIGAAFANGVHYADLYRRADSALYIAKHMGKDRFFINEENITCMRTGCISCRENCPRQKALNLELAASEGRRAADDEDE